MKLMMKVFPLLLVCAIEDCCLIRNLMLFLCAGLKSISRCSELSSLKLGICLNITDNGVFRVGMCCSKLTEVDLYRFVAFDLNESTYPFFFLIFSKKSICVIF